jgi:hypothetical protein
MFCAKARIEDSGGKAFLHVSIGETGEKAFPAGTDGGTPLRMFSVDSEQLAPTNWTGQC